MPRKTGRAPRRKTRARRGKTRKKTAVGRPMRPKTYTFCRSFVENVDLNSVTPPSNWTAVESGLVRSQPFALTDLPNYTEFTNLFQQYRLMAVKQEFYFGDTASVNLVTSGGQLNPGNRQIMLYSNPNPVGRANTNNLTEGFFLQSQSSKKRICIHSSGRPVRLYSKLKQLSKVFADEDGNTDYAKSYPKFVSTNEVNTEHYGIDTRIARVDGNNFSYGGTVYPVVKIFTKVWLQCRQVS